MNCRHFNVSFCFCLINFALWKSIWNESLRQMYILLWRPLLSIYSQLPIHLFSWMDRGDFGSLSVQRWEMLQPNTMGWCIWQGNTTLECKNSAFSPPVSAREEMSWRGATFQICLQGQLYLSLPFRFHEAKSL